MTAVQVASETEATAKRLAILGPDMGRTETVTMTEPEDPYAGGKPIPPGFYGRKWTDEHEHARAKRIASGRRKEKHRRKSH